MDDAPNSTARAIDQELAQVEARKRRSRRILIASAAFAVLGMGVLLLARRHSEKRLLTTSWDVAASCLLGGPLPEGESPSERFRAIELGAELQERWPRDCEESLRRLEQTLIKSKSGEALQAPVHALAKELHEGGSDNLAHKVALVCEAANTLGLTTDALEGPHGFTPEPVRAPSVSTLPDEARLTKLPLGPHTISADRWPSSELHLLLSDADDEGPPIVCTFVSTSADAQCRLVPAAATTTQPRLGGTSDHGASPLLFARDDDQDVVFRTDTGNVVAKGDLQTGWIAKSGFVALTSGPLNNDRGSFELIQQEADGAPPRKHQVDPEDLGATTITNWAIAHGLIVLHTVLVDDTADEPELPKIRYQRLPTNNVVSDFVDIGPLDLANAPMTFCRADPAVVLAFGGHSGYLTTFRDDQWSMPTFHDRLGKVIQCRPDGVLLHDYGPIRRCTKDGCQDAKLEDADFGELSVVQSRRAVVHDKLFAVALSDARGGLRYQRGKGSPELLLDDLMRHGKVQVNSTIKGTRMFSRPGFGVVALFTDDGVYAFHFTGEGAPTPAKITWR